MMTHKVFFCLFAIFGKWMIHINPPIYFGLNLPKLFLVIIDESNEHHFNRAKSTDSLPSMYNDGSSSGAHSLEPDINPDEQEEKARLISQVLELQNTLDGISKFL